MRQRELVRGRLSRLVSRAGVRPEGDGPLLEQFEGRTLLAAVTWDGGAGTNNWNDAANWNREGVDALPMDGDDVTIDVAANPTITYTSGTVTLNSLTTNEALTITGGNLGVTSIADINATLTLNGGTIRGGTWDVTGQLFRTGTSTSIIQDATIVGDIVLDSTSSRVRITGITRFGAIRLAANSATVEFTTGYTLRDTVIAEGAASGARNVTVAVGGSGPFTIGPTGVIRTVAGLGAGLNINNSSQASMFNNGLISHEAAGRALQIFTTSFTNNTTMVVTAGTLDITPTTFSNVGTITASADTALVLDGAWSNTGIINITDAALTMDGTFHAGDIGNLNRTGGTVTLTGVLTNSKGTITLTPEMGSWIMSNGEIRGGSITFIGGNRLIFTSSVGVLTDVQVNGELIFDTTSARARIAGTTRFTAARLQANSAGLEFAPNYVLHDLVVAEGATTGARSISAGVGGAGTLTIAPTGVIRLATGAGANLNISNSSQATIINQGLISAEAAGRTLSINTTDLQNHGALRVSDGTLNITPIAWANAATGTITATGGVLTLDGNWTSDGSIVMSNATINLDGNFSMADAGEISRTGGVVNLVGDATNTGETFTFNAARGTWVLLGGTIEGGTVTFAGAVLATSVSGGVLSNVQLNGEIVLGSTNHRVRMSGSTRFTAVRMTANATTLEFAPGYVLHDLVVVEGATTGARNIQGAVGGSGTLTIAPTGVIRLAQGSGGNLGISNSNQVTLINNGLITAEATGRTLSISVTELTNNGVLSATAGTMNVSSTTWTNAAAIQATDAVMTFSNAWSNTGTVTITNSTLNLDGTFNTVGIGTLVRTGGEVNLAGVLDNTGQTLALNAASGSWTLRNGRITGGVATVADGARWIYTNSGGELNNVEMNAEILINSTSSRVRVTGTTRFAAVRLMANAASIEFGPNYVLHDLVSAEGPVTGTRSIMGAVGGTGLLTIAPTGMIRLAADSGGNLGVNNSNLLTLVNNGVIRAEAPGRSLLFNNSVLTNNGTMEVSAGTLDINATDWTNAGTLRATGGTLDLDGNWTNTGSMIISDATLNAGGNFTTAGFGSMARTGGEVNLTGVMNNVGSTFVFNAGTGSWRLAGGTVNGGVITFTKGNRLTLGTSVGTLIDVQVNGDLVLDTTSARVRISGSTRFDAARLAANGANLEFAPGYVLHDDVIVEGAAGGGRSITAAWGGAGTLTISPTGSIRVAAGSGGSLTISDSSVSTLVNQGLIVNEATGRTLQINNSVFTNEGTVQASAGTVRISAAAVTNFAKGVLTGGEWNAFGPGVLQMPAKTVIVTNNATIGVGNAGSFPAVATLRTNNGTLQTGGGGTFTLTPEGGTLVNNGDVILAPGNVLNIVGDYRQESSGEMIVQLQDSEQARVGRMTVSGTARLNGGLTISLLNGYQPGCLNVNFLNAGVRMGEFETRTLPTLDDQGDQTLVIFIGNEARFAVSPPSDFNSDGLLNSQDVFDFLNAFFTADPIADYNNDGFTNSQDFFDFLNDFFEGCQ